MKPEQLQAIRERVNKATKGNWLWELGTGNIRVRWYESRQPIIAKVLIPEWHENQIMGSVEAANNAEFIAHAREDVPVLLSEIERLQPHNLVTQVDELLALGVDMRREIERLRGALEWYGDRRNYRTSEYDEMDVSDAQLDGGDRARQALAGESE